MDLSTLGTLIAGWLFGVLSPGLVARVERPKRRRELATCFARELWEIRYKAALVELDVRSQLGTIDVPTLMRLRPIIEDGSKTLGDTDNAERSVRLFGSDNQTAARMLNASGKNGVAKWAPPYHAPFLQAHLTDLLLFTPIEQMAYFRVVAELDLYNEQVEYVRLLLGRSFTLTGANHAINKGNIDVATASLARRAEMLISAISQATVIT